MASKTGKLNLCAELRALGGQRVHEGVNLQQIVFPLGGIGTGFVGLTGIGGLRHVSIANRPNYARTYPFTFPLIYAKEHGKSPVARVLRAPQSPPYGIEDDNLPHLCLEGAPHMDSATFRGEYPFAWIDFASKKLPVKVSLEAYNPFIPSDPDASGYPAAILRYTLKNSRRAKVDVTLAWSFYNCIGEPSDDVKHPGTRVLAPTLGRNVNEYRQQMGLQGLLMRSEKWGPDSPRFGSIALTTPEKRVTIQRYWKLTPSASLAPHEMWDVFATTGRFKDEDCGPTPEGMSSPGILGARITLDPGETRTVTFYLTWYFPNFEKYWDPDPSAASCCTDDSCKAQGKPIWKNYYAGLFDDAFDVALKLHKKEPRLYADTRAFHKAMFSSTFPPQALYGITSQMAILKTTTAIRLPDGSFYAFEGCTPGAGCCEGSCTHVWNYQQALPFLFPSLERSMHSLEYQHSMRDKGSMCFRIQLPVGRAPNDFHACVDGQLGGIIKAYRDWKISGDDAWLESLWPDLKKSLEFAWVDWDPDKDGVIDGVQHNTYDIEFQGPNPLSSFFYFGALEAAARMADHFNEPDKAAEYRAIHERGRAWVAANLWNGEYYEQQYDPEKAPMFQFGKGCISDALLGQWIARLSGIGYLDDPKRIKTTLRSIVKHNWRADLSEHVCPIFLVCALYDEAGLIACTWPRGGKPKTPFLYFDEVWSGIEYQVASHCIMEGLVDEGLRIAKGVWDRYDGHRRNPWDQYECCGGHHYSRVMSSYGLLLALSGFTFDKGTGQLGFAPPIHKEAFRTFWSLDGVWGTYEQAASAKRRTATISVLRGNTILRELHLQDFAGSKTVRAVLNTTLSTKALDATVGADGSVQLKRPLTLKAGANLTLEFRR
jgi:uncharacterized protein (DUF608 family)